MTHDSDMLPDPGERIAAIASALDSATREAGKDANAIEIVAVSKKHSAETARRALAAGHRVFGENRVQEALGKWPALKAEFPDCKLHLIGPLQTNKAKEAVGFFDVIESLDRPKLARVLSEQIAAQQRAPALYVQVNIGEEAQKAGVAPAETIAFVHQCQDEYGLAIEGLMCIPPADQPPAPYFALLAKLGSEAGLEKLSMGMSGDYEIAAQLGATSVRIGTEIFGKRPEASPA